MMKRAVTISKFLIYPVLGVMLSACNKDAVEATCASQETQTTLAKLISESVESKLSDERHSDGSFSQPNMRARDLKSPCRLALAKPLRQLATTPFGFLVQFW
jgi:hypothetical protein